MDIQEVMRARQGDREAFTRLMRQLESPMYAVAKQILQRDEDCADAMQETVLTAYKSVHALRDPAYFRTWMIRILINECRRLLKQRKKQIPLPNLSDKHSTSGGYEGMELREAIDSLDLPMRLVIVLHYMNDLPIKEVARTLDISEGTVKSRLYRAREKLLLWLEPLRGVESSYESR
ncbi:sigma-70 family RNA polymerase sigma factor [Cohnella terricola]|uniref:Sigma-70 family RNA polymerase sigma factor n=1 Tax=Cohnella terricola TaxID=1289167 RepID=A0A559JTJ5_9BACL|nr:sigma-70 family RNA polymerase sigma factor [Cohnella terricola]TVY03195.1 sigma-70 family RNA polymerase sigma factor [Cohnella terricola]